MRAILLLTFFTILISWPVVINIIAFRNIRFSSEPQVHLLQRLQAMLLFMTLQLFGVLLIAMLTTPIADSMIQLLKMLSSMCLVSILSLALMQSDPEPVADGLASTSP